MNEIETRIKKSIAVKEKLLLSQSMIQSIDHAGSLIGLCIKNGGKVVFCGNGGSFADAQHLCAEFVSKLIDDRHALPAIALGVNCSNITAIANDYGFETIFSRELSCLGNPDDVLVAITTSGKSENVLQAITTASQLGMKVILMTGEKKRKILADMIEINVPSNETMHIQEAHIMIGHIICEIAEKIAYSEGQR